MSNPVLIVSDLHCHAWSQFSGTTPDGVNERLQIICDEFTRAAQELADRGGNRIILAGDLFHVRGSIDPEVFNPVYETIKTIINIKNTHHDHLRIYAIPGNHDLKSKETTELGNAIQSLGGLERFFVITKPATWDDVVYLPWCATNEGVRAAIKDLKEHLDFTNLDLVMHAGIDGILMGVPDHGLSATEVASWGFRRVFAGHYHNHKILEEGRVISIGATTHQTWSDVGTKAGYLLVDGDKVEWRASNAPEFVDLDEDTEPEDIPLIVDGNYVRIRGLKLTDAEINQMRKELLAMNAKGVNFQVIRETATLRSSGAPTSALSLTGSIHKFIDGLGLADAAAVKAHCDDILTKVQTAAA